MSYSLSLLSFLSQRSTQLRNVVFFSQGVIDTLMMWPNATDEDKRFLIEVKEKLLSKEMSEIIVDHAEGKVNEETLNKMEKIAVEISDKVVEKMHQSPVVEVFVKVMNRLKIKEDRDEYESLLRNM